MHAVEEAGPLVGLLLPRPPLPPLRPLLPDGTQVARASRLVHDTSGPGRTSPVLVGRIWNDRTAGL